MLHLSDVLQFVIDSLDNSPLSCKQPVRHGHDSPFHVALEFGYQLDAVDKEPLEKLLADISFVADELAIQEFHESLMVERPAVIDIAGSYHKTEQFPFLVANEVQFEAKEPSHRTLASLGDTLERLMDMNALILAHPERCAVNKADTCTFAKQHLFDEQGQWNCHFFFQFHKAVVGNHFREKVAEPLADMLQIEMLQATIAGIMEEDDDNHHLGLG